MHPDYFLDFLQLLGIQLEILVFLQVVYYVFGPVAFVDLHDYNLARRYLDVNLEL